MKEKIDILDEKGFVFIGNDEKPYRCRIYCDEAWIMYWHEGNKAWVTLKKVNQSEIWGATEKKIPDEQAQIYHNLHKSFMGE